MTERKKAISSVLGQTALTSIEFKQVMSLMSAMSYLRSETVFSFTALSDLVHRSLLVLGLEKSATSDGYIQQLVESVCLVIQDGMTYEYLHRSFQEYFAAQFFKTLGRADLNRCGPRCSNAVVPTWSYGLAQMDRDLFELAIAHPALDRWLRFDDSTGQGDLNHFVAFTNSTIQVEPKSMSWLRDEFCCWWKGCWGRSTASFQGQVVWVR